MNTENKENNQKIQNKKQAVESSCNRINCNTDLAKYESLAKIALNAAGVIVIISPMISTFLIFMYLVKYHAAMLIPSVIGSVSNISYIVIIGFVLLIIFICFSFPFLIHFFIDYNKEQTNNASGQFSKKNTIIKILIFVTITILIYYIYYHCLNDLINYIWLFLIFSFLILILLSFLFYNFLELLDNKKVDIKKTYRCIPLSLILFPLINFLCLFFIIYSVNPILFNPSHYKLALIGLLFYISFFNAVGLFIKINRNKIIDKIFFIFLIMLLSIFFFSLYFIPYSKLAVRSIGLGHFEEKINLKPDAPAYVIKELKNAKLKDKNYFVLIQSPKNIYIIKHRKDCEELLSVPSEKYCRIITLPKKYIK